MKTRIRFGLLGLMLCTLCSCSKITEDTFNKVQNGMTSTEVKTLLGAPTHITTTGVFGVNGSTYLYAVKGKEIKVVFVNDKVVAKQGEFSP